MSNSNNRESRISFFLGVAIVILLVATYLTQPYMTELTDGLIRDTAKSVFLDARFTWFVPALLVFLLDVIRRQLRSGLPLFRWRQQTREKIFLDLKLLLILFIFGRWAYGLTQCTWDHAVTFGLYEYWPLYYGVYVYLDNCNYLVILYLLEWLCRCWKDLELEWKDPKRSFPGKVLMSVKILWLDLIRRETTPLGKAFFGVAFPLALWFVIFFSPVDSYILPVNIWNPLDMITHTLTSGILANYKLSIPMMLIYYIFIERDSVLPVAESPEYGKQKFPEKYLDRQEVRQ